MINKPDNWVPDFHFPLARIGTSTNALFYEPGVPKLSNGKVR